MFNLDSRDFQLGGKYQPYKYEDLADTRYAFLKLIGGYDKEDIEHKLKVFIGDHKDNLNQDLILQGLQDLIVGRVISLKCLQDAFESFDAACQNARDVEADNAEFDGE